MTIMSWPISGAAALLVAALVSGCERPPARQGAGVSRAPLWLPTQIARSPRRQVQVAGERAVSDDDLSQPKDVAIEPTPEPTEPMGDLQPNVEVASGLGVSSVRYALVQSSVPPDGMLSITQVALGPTASRDDAETDAIDALARRLGAEPQK